MCASGVAFGGSASFNIDTLGLLDSQTFMDDGIKSIATPFVGARSHRRGTSEATKCDGPGLGRLSLPSLPVRSRGMGR